MNHTAAGATSKLGGEKVPSRIGRSKHWKAASGCFDQHGGKFPSSKALLWFGSDLEFKGRSQK